MPRQPIAPLRLVTISGLGFALWMGCGQFLGLDDYSVQGGPATSGNADANAGGNGGQGGTTDAQAGDAGQSGNGGSAASSGCSTGFTPNDQVVRSCVLRSSCSPLIPARTISSCVTLNTQQAFGGQACTASATNCQLIQQCEGYGFTSECADSDTGWRCTNNRAVNCDNDYFVDCGKWGGNCTTYSSTGFPPDDSAGCIVEENCTDSPGVTVCRGSNLYQCNYDTGIFFGDGIGQDCSKFFAECKDLGGGPGCYFSLPDCGNTDGGVQACDEQTAQICSTAGLIRYPCATVGLLCAEGSVSPTCVAPGCAADDVTTCTESCSGSIASICYGGAPFEVDCTGYGFDACQMYDGSATGLGNYVVCVNN